MSFCRITGKARSLPKPNFFPIIPPISPADAQKLCRITSKRADEHKFVPLFEAGKRPPGLRCPVTGKNLGGRNGKVSSHSGGKAGKNADTNEGKGVGENEVDILSGSDNKASSTGLHGVQNDCKYIAPVLKRDAMEKGDLRAFEDLMKVLKELKNEMTASGEDDPDKNFVYMMPSMKCGLVVPAEVEEAIRRGELESVSLSQSCDRAIFKVRGKRTLFVPLREVESTSSKSKNKSSESESGEKSALTNLYDGKGQSKETLNRQKQEIENRRKKSHANKKMFEDLEKQAEVERQKDAERTQQGSKQKVPGSRRSKEAQQYRQKVEKFKTKFLASSNMADYGAFKKALKTNLHTIDWEKIGKLKDSDLKPLQMPAKRRKVLHEGLFDDPEVQQQLSSKRRTKNVYIPDQPGLEMVPVVEEFSIEPCLVPKELTEFIHASKGSSPGYTSSLKSMFACQESLKILPSLGEFEAICRTLNKEDGKGLRMGCMYDRGDGVKYAEDVSKVPNGANIIVGAVVVVPAGESGEGAPKFVPGERICVDGREVFVPGQRMNSAHGEFVPGASIRSDDGVFQFIPGIVSGDSSSKDGMLGCGQFRAGQFVGSGEGAGNIKFLKGQVVHTAAGNKFVEGETISTADGMKFVAGVSVDTKEGPVFLPGALVETGENETNFVSGYLMGSGADSLTFLSGRTSGKGSAAVFVPGQTINGDFVEGQMVEVGEGDKKTTTFLPGAVVTDPATGDSSFIPGVFDQAVEGGADKFVAGVVIETVDGALFIEGRLLKDEEGEKGEAIFAPGRTSADGHFQPAAGPTGMAVRRTPEPGESVDGATLAVNVKRAQPKNGRMVRRKDGSTRFFGEGEEVPAEALQDGEAVPGRMECGENGPAFVPGVSMELNGIRSFIPGKVMDGVDGRKSFVPGKVINTKNGPKFVCGQVIQTEDGEKFLPGVVMDVDGQGKVFVPAMEMQTKTGSMLIPGQVIRTDNGLKFVPGDMVSTENGALFVPGLVMDSPDGAKLLHGEVIQTAEGPRLLPPDVKGDGNLELCVQGFDINLEEARLLLGKNCSSSDVVSDQLLGGVGGAVVAPEALKALAEGFDAVRADNLIPTMGANLDDADKVLEDELLDAYDSPKARRVIKRAFIKVMAELAKNLPDVKGLDQKSEMLSSLLDETLLKEKGKLNPALEKLKVIFEEKKPGTTEADDIMKLLAGMITCSIPGALKECSSGHSELEESKLEMALWGCVEDSVSGILQDDGIVPNGLREDMKELVALVRELEPGESNKSFFAKVAEVSDGRCNSKFMDQLLEKVAAGDSLEEMGGEAAVTSKLMAIMGNKVELKEAFQTMAKQHPAFVELVLNNLEMESKENENMNAADLLHNAVVRTVEDGCQRQLNRLIAQLEQSGGALTDDDIKSMLKQAIGLARFMGREYVVDALNGILNDPHTVSAIREDAVTRGILRKILVMRKLAGRDSAKRRKLDKLEKYSDRRCHEEDDSSDSSLRRFIDQSEALTRGPVGSRLKKSKSVVKKSKSMIMTAKDIPMNAFLAMKNTADEKDERWLQNFLSESVVEDVPWECSKALIILKEGFQAIIPREASRSILLGEASYTLIDDNGIEFYLSAADKRNRERREQQEDDDDVAGMGMEKLEDETKAETTTEEQQPSRSEGIASASEKKSLRDVLEADPHYKSVVKAAKEEDLRERLKDPLKGDFTSYEGKRRGRDFPYPTAEEGADSAADPSSRRRPPPKKFEWEDEAKEGDTMDSLEKYRPHNYDFGKRSKRGDGAGGGGGRRLESSASVDHSDINDLRDYYSGIGTRHRALKRLNLLSGGHSGEDHFDEDAPTYDGRYGTPHHRQVAFGDADDDGQHGATPSRRKSTTALPPQHHEGGGMVDRDRFKHSKNFWLDEVDNARKRSGLPTKKEQMAAEEEAQRQPQRVYNWEEDTFETPGGGGRMDEPAGRTRNLLDQVKESTMALQGLNEQVNDDAYDRMGYSSRRQHGRRQQPQEQQMGYGGGRRQRGGGMRSASLDEESPYFASQRQQPAVQSDRDHYASLADEVLAGPRRKFSQAENRREPSSYLDREEDQFRGGGGGYSRRAPVSPARDVSAGGSGWRDTEDVDAMIADLKKKTTGRDMREVLRNLDSSSGRGGGGGDYYSNQRGREDDVYASQNEWGMRPNREQSADFSYGGGSRGGAGGGRDVQYGGRQNGAYLSNYQDEEDFGGGGRRNNYASRGSMGPQQHSPPPPASRRGGGGTFARGGFQGEDEEEGMSRGAAIGGRGVKSGFSSRESRQPRALDEDFDAPGRGGPGGGGNRSFTSRFLRPRDVEPGEDQGNDFQETPKRRFGGRRQMAPADDDDDDGGSFAPPSVAPRRANESGSIGRDFGGGGAGGGGGGAKGHRRMQSVLDEDED